MKYAGMPFGMWALFAGSFQKQLIAVLCYDADTAKAIQRFKTACGMSGDLSCSLTSFSSERSSNIQRRHPACYFSLGGGVRNAMGRWKDSMPLGEPG